MALTNVVASICSELVVDNVLKGAERTETSKCDERVRVPCVLCKTGLRFRSLRARCVRFYGTTRDAKDVWVSSMELKLVILSSFPDGVMYLATHC
jgi:hypothetical protein